MAHILMAFFAYASEIAFPLAIDVYVVNIQRQLREFLYMLFMVNKFCPTEPALLFVNLALSPIQIHNFGTFLFPLPGKVEPMDIPRCY